MRQLMLYLCPFVSGHTTPRFSFCCTGPPQRRKHFALCSSCIFKVLTTINFPSLCQRCSTCGFFGSSESRHYLRTQLTVTVVPLPVVGTSREITIIINKMRLSSAALIAVVASSASSYISSFQLQHGLTHGRNSAAMERVTSLQAFKLKEGETKNMFEGPTPLVKERDACGVGFIANTQSGGK